MAQDETFSHKSSMWHHCRVKGAPLCHEQSCKRKLKNHKEENQRGQQQPPDLCWRWLLLNWPRTAVKAPHYGRLQGHRPRKMQLLTQTDMKARFTARLKDGDEFWKTFGWVRLNGLCMNNDYVYTDSMKRSAAGLALSHWWVKSYINSS